MKNHGEISKWLMHEDQKALFEILVAIILNVVFLALITLLLWSLGKPMLAFRLAKGYGCLWVVIYVTFVLLFRIQRLSRVNIYDRPNAFVISNLAVSCLLQVGWSAFAALLIHNFVTGAAGWMAAVLHLVGVLSCLIAFFAVSSFYQGHIYKLVSLPLALVSFFGFSIWPASSRAIYGWFFNLF
jgi:hypothetical protein